MHLNTQVRFLQKLHVQHFKIRPVVGIDEASTPVDTAVAQKAYFENIAIEQLELSLRAYNCLKRAQILTLADLSRESYSSLLALRNFGQKSQKK